MTTRQTVRKAVIPAAGYGTRLFPATKSVRKELFPVVDRDGLAKPIIQLIVEEAIDAGIEEVCIVVAPGGDEVFRSYFSAPDETLQQALAGKVTASAAGACLQDLGGRISYVVQHTQDGYGDAVYCASEWVGDDPVLVMLGDHVYISGEEHRCARQLIDVFEQRHAPVSGVIQKEEQNLRLFGTIAGQRIDNTLPVTYEVSRIVEKPDIAYAREYLRVEDLPSSAYLCFFGMHVMTPDIFDCLAMLKTRNLRDREEIQLTHAQEMLMTQRPYYACEINGEHYDIGVPEGFVRTIRAFAEPRIKR